MTILTRQIKLDTKLAGNIVFNARFAQNRFAGVLGAGGIGLSATSSVALMFVKTHKDFSVDALLVLAFIDQWDTSHNKPWAELLEHDHISEMFTEHYKNHKEV